MRLDVSEKSFNIIKHLLSCTYVELNYRKEKHKNLPWENRSITDTAEVVKTALSEIGVKVTPTKIELDKEGNFK